jgi:hypothetical protein
MAHELSPRSGSPFLTPEEVVRRLRAAFPSVHVDPERGAAGVDAQLAHMRRIAGPGQPFSTAEVEEKQRNRGRAVHVAVTDAGVTLATVVEVDEGLFFAYESAAEEGSAVRLVERMAEALGYDWELV